MLPMSKQKISSESTRILQKKVVWPTNAVNAMEVLHPGAEEWPPSWQRTLNQWSGCANATSVDVAIYSMTRLPFILPFIMP